MTDSQQRPIAVVGAGAMGMGIAAVFARAGHEVSVYDDDPALLARLPELVARQIRDQGLEPGAASRIRAGTSLSHTTAHAAIVFESASERLEQKQAVIARLSECTSPATILATNTSAATVGEIARGAHGAHRIVGSHWWNPPLLVPLVELIPSERSSADAIQRTEEILTAADVQTVHVRRDVPGAVGNRLLHAMLREAFALVAEGVCSAETVDAVVTSTFGRRLPVTGPFETADWWGLDVVLEVHEQLVPHLDRSTNASPRLRELVNRGELGMATGRGFRQWVPRAADRLSARLLCELRRTSAGAD